MISKTKQMDRNFQGHEGVEQARQPEKPEKTELKALLLRWYNSQPRARVIREANTLNAWEKPNEGRGGARTEGPEKREKRQQARAQRTTNEATNQET